MINEMDIKEFVKRRKAILKRKDAALKKINLQYTEIADGFIADNSPYKTGDVIDMLDNKKYKRMAIYQHEIKFLFDENSPCIVILGWLLNDKGEPCKWDNGYLTGISNPAKTRYSANQHHILAEVFFKSKPL
jgi:hypothetical protein